MSGTTFNKGPLSVISEEKLAGMGTTGGAPSLSGLGSSPMQILSSIDIQNLNEPEKTAVKGFRMTSSKHTESISPRMSDNDIQKL